MKKNKTNEVSDNYVIGLDCSTTAVKAAVFDKHGNIIGKAASSISLHSPKRNYYEQNAEDWWEAAKKSLKEITKQVNPNKILSLAVSNQRETFVTLDKTGKCIRPAMIWLDERCKDEVEPFAAKVGRNRIHSITGKPVDYAPVVYRLAWMQKHEPKSYKKIAMVCDVQAFINWKLIGSFKTSWASADPLGIFDMKKKKWSKEILNELDLDETKLPETFCSGTVLGNISDSTAKLTGLRTQTLVIAGGGDGQSAGLGANVLSSTRAYLNLGTAVVAGVFDSTYKTNDAFRTMCSCSDYGYYLESSLRAGTFSIDWFVEKVLKIDKSKFPNIYKELEQETELISVGSDGLIHLPYLCGVMNPYWDESARASFIGISSSHTRAHFYRAILEGIAFEIMFEIEIIEKKLGVVITELVAIGGGTTSKLWTQIVADITGKKILIPKTSEASALGAAMMAAVGAGMYPVFAIASKSMSSIVKIIRPNSKRSATYSTLFEKYKKIYPLLKQL